MHVAGNGVRVHPPAGIPYRVDESISLPETLECASSRPAHESEPCTSREERPGRLPSEIPTGSGYRVDLSRSTC